MQEIFFLRKEIAQRSGFGFLISGTNTTFMEDLLCSKDKTPVKTTSSFISHVSPFEVL